jgi:hypothetical protein
VGRLLGALVVAAFVWAGRRGPRVTRPYDEAERAALAEELAALQEEVDPLWLGEDV